MAVTSGDSAEDHAAPSSSSRKMKFLCSFGGKILPRPSDGALRYVGGHTRIISLRRDSSLEELRAKLSDVFGGTAVFKYQLPDEDLDALVTVSSAEDLENMMEEYDKLAEISPDGSAKLRVFLFSPSEIEFPGLTVELDGADPEYRYMDAVNAVAELGLSDFSSVRTSNELVDCNFGVVSASNLSPVSSEGGKGVVTAAQDPFELVGPPVNTVDEQSYVSVSLDYLESLQLGSRGVEDLEQRGRIEYLNSRLRGDQIQQFSSPLEIESGSDQFLDVFASQKSENINQTSLSIDPEAPFSYFDNIMRQHPPPVGPPQFLLKQDLINDPLGIPFIPGQKNSEVNLLPSKKSTVNDPWNLLAKPDIIPPSEAVDHGTEVGLEPTVNPIPKSQRGDQALMGQSTKSQRSNVDHLMDMNPSKVNTQKASPSSSHHDDKTQRNSSSEEHVPNEEGKSAHTEKAALGFGVLEDHGVRLQIIKNSDLEELRELGTGAFGTVYHGKWRGTDVAIKRINDRCFAGKPSEQERLRVDFWNEACKLADLHHPNVVAFYGVVIDEPGGSMATVTEFMVNGSLWQALRENDKSLDQRKRRLIAMDVAFGMEYLHGKNIVHFDLKSDNLLVNLGDPNRPICKVGDLGLSKVKRQTLISGGVIGTLPWMAPELLNGRSTLVSEKVDVFSFGIVMWELLTGEEPYADLHHGAIIGGIVSDTLRPTIPESCDEEWRALMVACWSTDPADRPSFTVIAAKLRAMAQRSQNSFVLLPRENS